MDNSKIIDLENYKTTLTNKQKIDNKEVELDELSLEELEDVKDVYASEVKTLQEQYKVLKKENEKLRAKAREMGLL